MESELEDAEGGLETRQRSKDKREGMQLRRTSDMFLSIQKWIRASSLAPGKQPQQERSLEAVEPQVEQQVVREAAACNFHHFAARHHCPLFAVREAWQEFSAYSKHPASGINQEEFLEVLRRRAQLKDGAPIPAHLMGALTQKDLDSPNQLTFDAFLDWSISVGWFEEMQSVSTQELEVRRIAREVNMPILDVEKVKALFDHFDSDGSGKIEESEFRDIVFKLWRVEDASDVPVKTLQRIWRQIDQDSSGTIDFTEFLVWYSNFKKFGARLNMI